MTSGPTELAGNAARSVQKYDTDGLGMLSEGVQSIDLDSTNEDLCQRHKEEILVPLKTMKKTTKKPERKRAKQEEKRGGKRP